ncbi:hypothetical protein SeLEV6574_g02749 [Synchytrium endobioticum]|uniref:Uncharacterized protein n=1 Tax=Synchytrium endobioticum TaxID=286115 RepID=A0A507D783_9FUNG|nr:hypothetical protein SeLEV6574_g02749 [Synchytrium endobioticum]
MDFEDQTALRCAVIFSLVASLLIGTAGIAGVAATNDPPQEPGLIGAVGSIVLRIYCPVFKPAPPDFFLLIVSERI